MSATKSSGKKRRSDVEAANLEKIMKHDDNDIFGADISKSVDRLISAILVSLFRVLCSYGCCGFAAISRGSCQF